MFTMNKNTWTIEKRKHGREIYVVSQTHCIFVGEGYDIPEYQRSMYLSKIIVKALNKHDRWIVKNALPKQHSKQP